MFVTHIFKRHYQRRMKKNRGQNIFTLVGVSDSRLEKFEAVHCSETTVEKLKEFLCCISQTDGTKEKSCFEVFYMQKASDLWLGKFTCRSKESFKYFYHVFKIKAGEKREV